MPWADGMLLEDYKGAVTFRGSGVPDPTRWCDDLKRLDATTTPRGLA